MGPGRQRHRQGRLAAVLLATVASQSSLAGAGTPSMHRRSPTRSLPLRPCALRGGSGSLPSSKLTEFRSKLAKFAPPDLLAEFDALHSGGGGAGALDGRKAWPKDWYPTKDEPVEGSVKVSFEFMTDFIIDTLLAYGVPAGEAEQAADVLIEADKRGISSHGIGRLKPIYCDRLDAGILSPTAPVTVERDVGATALVNGNLGLGLTIGPRYASPRLPLCAHSL